MATQVIRAGRKKVVTYAGVGCPRCRTPLRHETITSGRQVCPACAKPFEAIRFDPPILTPPEAAILSTKEQAACATHARNPAVAHCQRCGQFICTLCRIEVETKTYCPPCFDRLASEGTIPGAANRIKNYPALSVVCLLFSVGSYFFLAPVLGLVGVYFAIRGFMSPETRRRPFLLLFWTPLVLLLCLGSVVAGILVYIAILSGGNW